MLSVILAGLLTALAVLHTLEMKRHALGNHYVKYDLKRPKQKHPIHTMLFFSKLVSHKSRSAKMSVFFLSFQMLMSIRTTFITVMPILSVVTLRILT